MMLEVRFALHLGGCFKHTTRSLSPQAIIKAKKTPFDLLQGHKIFAPVDHGFLPSALLEFCNPHVSVSILRRFTACGSLKRKGLS